MGVPEFVGGAIPRFYAWLIRRNIRAIEKSTASIEQQIADLERKRNEPSGS